MSDPPPRHHLHPLASAPRTHNCGQGQLHDVTHCITRSTNAVAGVKLLTEELPLRHSAERFALAPLDLIKIIDFSDVGDASGSGADPLAQLCLCCDLEHVKIVEVDLPELKEHVRACSFWPITTASINEPLTQRPIPTDFKAGRETGELAQGTVNVLHDSCRRIPSHRDHRQSEVHELVRVSLQTQSSTADWQGEA